jgi:hypothetical protein|tara:strand:- start:18 stop:344 length:327 start_codon:yes stop_codon:yes gene_type:complete
MRHEEYMKMRMKELQPDEEKLMDEFYANKLLNLKDDMVNSPPHYNKAGIECIDAIAAATGDGYEHYLQGNIMKYLWRYRYKNGTEDLKKAQWYLVKLIEEVEGCYDES